jgi:hypothetical protein
LIRLPEKSNVFPYKKYGKKAREIIRGKDTEKRYDFYKKAIDI